MSHSFTNLLYHIIFSTKNREPWLDGDVGPRVFAYFGGLVREQGGIAIAVGGVADHVHLLAKLPQDHNVADVFRHLKARSSFWIHNTFDHRQGFAWQTGYGAFTVSQSQLDVVRTYVLSQEDHHRRQSFQDEFRRFLRKHTIEYTEDQLWD